MSSKRKITAALALLAVAALALLPASAFAVTSPVPGKITTIVHEGNELILNPDSTWTYKNATLAADADGDVYIPLSDGRILWLKSDFTWAFTKTQPPKSNRPKTYPVVAASGTSTMQSLDVATKAAMNQVYDKIAANLAKYIMSKDKKAKEYLMACIKDAVKENEFDQNYAQIKGGNWKADAKVSILGHRVKDIIECLDTQLEPAEEAAPAKK
jgi:hypothetical protein